jgi:hypothetical protein
LDLAGVLCALGGFSVVDVTLVLPFAALAGALTELMAASLNAGTDFLAGFVALARDALGVFPSEDLLMAGPFSE